MTLKSSFFPNGAALAAFSLGTLSALGGAAPAHAADDAVVVTATRFPERALDAPVGVRIISGDDIAASGVANLPELLAKFGGLYIRNNAGSPDQQLDLRGFGITGDQNTLVLVDGVRINENDLSSTRLSSIPLNSIERIEILPGSGAVLYGGGASGGTVHVITKGPQPRERSASLYAGAGSDGLRDFRAGGSVAGDAMGLTLNGSHLESDGYRQNNALRQDDISGDLRYGTAATHIGIKFGADRQRLRLPGVRDENQYANDPRGATTPNDYSFRDGGNVALYARHSAGRLELAADLYYRQQLSAIFTNAIPLYGETKLDTQVFSPRAKLKLDTFGMAGELVLGGDFTDGNYKRRFAGNPAGLTAPALANYASQNSDALYAQYSVLPTAATKLSLGWRGQRVRDRLNTVSVFGPPTDLEQSRTPKAWEAALRHDFNDSWAVLAKLGTSFRVATVDDNGQTVSGALLEPQTARNRELGMEYHRAGLRLRANLYRTDIENEIYFSPLAFAAGAFFPGANTNLSPTQRSGAELGAEWRPLDSLQLNAALTLQRATFRSGVYGGVDVSGKDVPLVPKRLLVLRAAWNATPRLSANAAVRYVGTQRYDNDQANAFPGVMPAYTLGDLGAAYVLGSWRLGGGVNNVTDRKYFSYGIVGSFACATPSCVYPEAGRTYFASAQYDFK